jgi:hypothetical protein
MTWETQTNIKPEEEKEKKELKMEFKKLKDAKQSRGIKILSYGNFSTGKTHFALTSDAPVYVIDTENGVSPLADKFPEINVMNISNMDNDNVEEKDEVKNFENYMNTIEYLSSLPDEQVGTIIIDSISDIWDWAQAYAKVKVFKIGIEDRLKQQWDWGTINKLYLKPLQKLINKNCNVILTAREAETYEGAGKPSGRFEPKCQKKTPYWVDVVLHHEIKFVNNKILFQAKIEKCRQKGELIGKIIESPDINKLKEMLK